MKRFPWSVLLASSAALLICTDAVYAQLGLQPTRTLGQQFRNQIIDAEIGGARVDRNAEITRLEKIIQNQDDRLVHVERQLLGASRLPGVTIAEAEAALEFATAQFQETEERSKNGEASEVDVKRDRLALVRAQGQLDSARIAHAEHRLLAELNFAFASRQVWRLSREKKQLERFVAKGYTSSEGLRNSMVEYDLAEKQLELARLRLEASRRASQSESETTSAEADPPTDTEAD